MRRALFMLLCMIVLTGQLLAQARTITGKVTDATGNPIPNASVMVKGTSTGTTTADDGSFTLTLPDNARTLVITAVGLADQEISIGNRTSFAVSMATAEKDLQEVVVVGYGQQTQRIKTQTVSVVKADAFRNQPIISATQALQGQAAGVQMVNSSGVLGAQSTIRIRGASSIQAGGQPLFVVDGVPLNDNVLTSAQGGGTGLNPLIDINPNDIESMTVLKDAAAVAIYGSRGSNGVVIINTKKGKGGQKTRINFDYFTGFSKPTNLLEQMDGDQFRTFVTDYRAARGLSAITFPTGTFDWVDAVQQQGRTNSYAVSATGGSEKTRFYIGGAYYNEKAFTIGNDLDRISARMNIEHDVSKRVKIGTNIGISNTTSDRIGVENNTFAPLTSSYLQLPYVTPYDDQGNFKNTGFIQNVLAIEALNTNKFKQFRVTGNAFAEIKLIDNLKFKSDWGIDNQQVEERTRSVNLLTPGGSGSRFISQDIKWLTTNTLNYEKDFGEHHIGLLAGHSFEKSQFDDITIAGNGFASDRLPNVSSASTPTTTSASRSAWALESYLGRLNYRLMDKYLFEASIRRDGSSRFGSANKYGNFWAVSGGWVISSENFMKNVTWVDLLKLTASYGTSGNDRIGNFPYQALYGGGTGADYNGQAGLVPNQPPNPFLSWEETEQFDLGLAAALFNSRVNFEVNVFRKRTTNNLVNLPLPFTTGYPSVNQNIGEIENRGIDLNLNTVNFRTKDFTWTTTLNMGFLKNEVLSLPTNKDEEGRDFLLGSTAQRAIVGHSLNTFYLIRYKGINPQTGDAEWLDATDKVTTAPLARDRKIVGSAIPKFSGGFTNTFNYKNFDLNVFFNFSYGNKVLIDGLRFTENLGSGAFNKTTNVLNYWKAAGDNAFAPALTSSTAPIFNQLSTLQMLDGSFMRLKMLTLGYNLPESIVSRTNLFSRVRFYVMGQNLWTWQNKDFRGPDPEVSANGANNQVQGESFFALPQARTFTFGVNIGF